MASKSALFNSDALLLHRELGGHSASTETVKSKMSKKLAKAQRDVDIARSWGIPLDEILAYHQVQNPLFDGDQLSKPSKSEMVTEIEKLLQPGYWKFEKCTDEDR